MGWVRGRFRHSSEGLRSLDSKFSHAFAQGTGRETQGSCGSVFALDLPVGFFEGPDDVLGLELGKSLESRAGSAGFRTEAGNQYVIAGFRDCLISSNNISMVSIDFFAGESVFQTSTYR